VHQQLPRWETKWSRFGTAPGVLEIVINERGTVDSAVMRVPLNRFYDVYVLNEAKSWRYTPALKDGKPVRYRKAIQVTLPAG